MSSCLCCDLRHDRPELLYFRHYRVNIIFCEKKITVVFLGLYGSLVQVQVAQYSVL